MRAAGRGAPYVNLSEGRGVLTSYVGIPGLVQALEQNTARPLSLAAADFDEDGMPDLVSGYASGGAGIITIHRGNADSIYPNAPEAQEHRAKGTFTNSPFLSPGHVFAVRETADFIGAGDFDGDSHWDIVAARRGGSTLYLMSGDGNGGVISTKEIPIGGAITFLVTGEINRKDGLEDVIVAIQSENRAKALVFEGPEGALRAQPEELTLPAPATSIALGQLDNEYTFDLAIAADTKLLLVHGRDRKLSLDEEKKLKLKRPV